MGSHFWRSSSSLENGLKNDYTILRHTVTIRILQNLIFVQTWRISFSISLDLVCFEALLAATSIKFSQKQLRAMQSNG
jgi:hypothetical protein